MKMKFHNRENLKNLIDEDFFKYYKRKRNRRPKKLSRQKQVITHVNGLLKELNDMLVEANHGIHLKNFGVIVPKDTILEIDESVLKRKQIVTNRYRLFFEDEFYSQNYTVRFSRPSKRNKDRLRSPRPHAVILHRNKIKKNKLKDE